MVCEWPLRSKIFFVKLMYLISRVFLAWTFWSFLQAYYVKSKKKAQYREPALFEPTMYVPGNHWDHHMFYKCNNIECKLLDYFLHQCSIPLMDKFQRNVRQSTWIRTHKLNTTPNWQRPDNFQVLASGFQEISGDLLSTVRRDLSNQWKCGEVGTARKRPPFVGPEKI